MPRPKFPQFLGSQNFINIFLILVLVLVVEYGLIKTLDVLAPVVLLTSVMFAFICCVWYFTSR